MQRDESQVIKVGLVVGPLRPNNNILLQTKSALKDRQKKFKFRKVACKEAKNLVGKHVKDLIQTWPKNLVKPSKNWQVNPPILGQSVIVTLSGFGLPTGSILACGAEGPNQSFLRLGNPEKSSHKQRKTKKV